MPNPRYGSRQKFRLTLDEVTELVRRAPASRALGAAGDRAVSPGDQNAPSASAH